MLDKDIKIKANLLQKLRNNKIFTEKQVINITYKQGKSLKLSQAEDEVLNNFCLYLSENKKSQLAFFTKLDGEEENTNGK